MSQQNLSAYIKKLEEYYGLTLFNRKPSFSLTSFGSEVYRAALEIEHILNNLDSECNNLRRVCSIQIGFTQVLAHNIATLLPIDEYRATYPEVKIRLQMEKRNVLENLLEKGSLDLFFAAPSDVYKPVSDFIETEFAILPAHILISPALLHSVFNNLNTKVIETWQKDGIDLIEFDSVPFILLEQSSSQILNDMQKRGYHLEMMMETNDINTAINACRNAIGALFVPWLLPTDIASGLLDFPVKAPTNLNTTKIIAYTTRHSLDNPFRMDFWNLLSKDK